MGDELDALSRESIRLFRKYVDVFVEPFGICPWSASSRRDGHVREVVLRASTPSIPSVLACIDALALEPHIEIGILLFPRVDLDRPHWARFVADVRAEDAMGRPVPFAMAEFHPQAAPLLEPSGSFISFVRRTPDPTIQLVRRTALDRVRGEEDQGSGFFDPAMIEQLLERQLLPRRPQLHDRVETHNRAAISAAGLDKVAALLDDLKRERDTSYAAISASSEDASAA